VRKGRSCVRMKSGPRFTASPAAESRAIDSGPDGFVRGRECERRVFCVATEVGGATGRTGNCLVADVRGRVGSSCRYA